MIRFTGHQLDAVVVPDGRPGRDRRAAAAARPGRGPGRRHRGRHPAPPGGLPRADRAADRGLPRRAASSHEIDGLGEVAEVTAADLRGPRRHPGELTGGRLMGLLDRGIEIKTPEQIDACAGPAWSSARRSSCCAATSAPASRPPSSTRSPRTASAPRARRRRSWATTASPPRSAPRSTTRSCTASPATGCWPTATWSRSTAARSSTGWHGDAAITVAVGAVPAEVTELMRGHRGVDVARDRRRPPRRPGHRHLATRSSGYVRAPGPLRHPRGLHRPRHRLARCTSRRTCPTTAARARGPRLVRGPGARGRADDHPRHQGDRPARRRLDGRHHRRQLGRALRAHLHDHPERHLGAHRARRRRAAAAELGVRSAAADACDRMGRAGGSIPSLWVRQHEVESSGPAGRRTAAEETSDVCRPPSCRSSPWRSPPSNGPSRSASPSPCCSSTSSSSPATRTSRRFKECAIALSVYIGAAVAFGAWIWVEPRPRHGDPVLRRLADGVLALDRQPVRLHHLDGGARVPREYQQEALMVGIILALIFRGIFIALGYQLIENFSWVFYVFGAFLVYTAVDAGQELPQPRGRAPRGQPGRPVRAEPPQRRREYHGAQALVPQERRAVRLADADRDHRARHHRPAVRARLDPGDLRHHPGAVPGLHRQRVRADGAAPALLPARRAARAAGLPLARASRSSSPSSA